MLPIGLSSALASLPALGISDTLVNDLRAFLEESAGALTDSTPDAVGASAFGGSPASRQCASDAAKARKHVADALIDMSAGLQGYGQIVVNLRNTTRTIEEVTEADLTRMTAQANACVAPSFAAPSQCALPGSSSGGDR